MDDDIALPNFPSCNAGLVGAKCFRGIHLFFCCHKSKITENASFFKAFRTSFHHLRGLYLQPSSTLIEGYEEVLGIRIREEERNIQELQLNTAKSDQQIYVPSEHHTTNDQEQGSSKKKEGFQHSFVEHDISGEGSNIETSKQPFFAATHEQRKLTTNIEDEKILLSWRDLLGKIISKPGERQRIAASLKINSVTITRWIVGSAHPRSDILRTLPNITPQYRERLTQLLVDEYPDLFTNEIQQVNDINNIPSSFYQKIFNTIAQGPEILRTTSLRTMIMQEILRQLDPNNEGTIVFIAQCVPPSPGQKVHSLYKTMEPGGWPLPCFFGLESQIGQTALVAHPIILQNAKDAESIIPSQQEISLSSSATMPILSYDSIAGCLHLTNPQAGYFSPARVKLLNQYANLLTSAFNPEDFYRLSDLNLEMMLSPSQQEPILKQFQKRATEYILLSSQKGQLLSRFQAEREIIQQMEEEIRQIFWQNNKQEEYTKNPIIGSMT